MQSARLKMPQKGTSEKYIINFGLKFQLNLDVVYQCLLCLYDAA